MKEPYQPLERAESFSRLERSNTDKTTLRDRRETKASRKAPSIVNESKQELSDLGSRRSKRICRQPTFDPSQTLESKELDNYKLL